MVEGGGMSLGVFEDEFARCSNWGRWGPDDERGTLNLLTAERVAAGTALARTGQQVSCASPLNTVTDVENSRPVVHVMLRGGDVASRDGQSWTADQIAVAPHGWAHSHLDALCHVSWRGQLYNGRPADAVRSTGASANAITIGAQGIVGRGVLLDMPAASGADWLEPGTAITPNDLERAAAAERVRVGEGDLVLVRTGRQRRRRELGPWEFFSSAAGLDHTCGPWLHDRGVAVLGSDGCSDVLPSGIAEVPQPIHVLALVAMGMQLLDNLDLEALAEACARERRREFLLVVAPLRIVGGTASLVNPIAVF
jgi:kynurenine formamidase